MTSAFSSSDAAAIKRQVDQSECEDQTEHVTLESFWLPETLEQCASWIRDNQFLKVCLQFPDSLLVFSSIVSSQLQEHVPVGTGIFILGDTSYGSCCVDEVAASHVGADAVIHFGHACLSRSVRLPTRYVFLRYRINWDQFQTAVKAEFTDTQKKLAIFYDVGYTYCIDKITKSLKEKYHNLSVGQLAENGTQPDLLCWKLDGQTFEDSSAIYVGKDNQSFFNTSNGIKTEQWYRFDPTESKLNPADPLDSKWLRRRWYYIEKCKDATSLGIVVATLTANGYLDVVSRIQQMAKARGVRSYIISVGKINPAKLANFMEIDCFVLVGCPENNLFNSRDFFKPLVSVFECELAFNPAWTGQFPASYSADFSDVLPTGRLHKTFEPETDPNALPDVSLVTGKVRNVVSVHKEEETEVVNGCRELLLRGKNEVAQVSSGDAFQDRSWQGLEQNLGKDAPALVEEGRSGIPIKYENDL
ncbi:2-(3-amino-3-carboxypropyl)histidine synthase subunit 2 [Uranotaenia lowii]|uniref:2-(3-amino-3-carboxypropyl)histidine synthase subunit 2 n=1 Tax=Uranotaenia lowii TaxID=190385 RepID=UPI002478C6EC|nr:2-(3-amino-3-carboxypropyl)histidine synthase subunit 2 [Uranotaenia lowii]